MSTKRSRAVEPQVPLGADDFKLIDGVGSGLAQRLYDAGIRTFAQLAELTPQEIVAAIGAVIGLSAHRIAEQNWVGQARSLAAQSALSEQSNAPTSIEQPPTGSLAEPSQETSVDGSEGIPRQRSALFTVQLELRPDGSVRRTLAKHARTESGEDRAEQWPGWDALRLVSFIEQRAMLRHVPELVRAENPDAMADASAQPAVAELSGSPVLRQLDTVPVDAERPNNILSHDQAFQVRIALDLTDVVMPEDQPLSYVATILAKRMDSGSGAREQLGEAHGQIAHSDILALDIPAKELAEGLYRLEALVDLGLPSASPKPQHTVKTRVRGGLLQIY